MLPKLKLNNYKILKWKHKFLKNEIKKIILKSIIYNQKITPQVRAYAQLKQEFLKKQISITKHYNTCLETGKNKAIINKFNRSRQIVKNKGINNLLTNTKIKSW